MKTSYKGINYAGFTGANRHPKTGIRYGIIPENAVGQSWYDASEPDYGSPHCPHCGNELKSGKEYKRCPHCYKAIGEYSECFNDEACCSYLDSAELKAFSDDSGDLWVTESEYFTYAQFCSPCAPGACYLSNPLDSPDEDNKCYCLGHDWFEGGIAPYPVYSVKTGKQITATRKTVNCGNCNGSGRDTIARVAQARQCDVSDVDPKSVTDYRASDQTFECWRCNGKGTQDEIEYTEQAAIAKAQE